MKRALRQSGFTLIEMTVVITVLALMAALVIPNFVAIKKSREVRHLEIQLRRLPQEARQEARAQNTTVALRVDGNALVMERIPASDDEEAQEIKRIPLTDDVQVESAEGSDVASWEWRVYPDGSAVGGTLKFRENNVIKSLKMPAEGEARWISEDEEEEEEDDQWAAGEMEQRS